MVPRKKTKSFFFFLNTALILVVVFSLWVYFSRGGDDKVFSRAEGKKIFLNLDGLEFVYATNQATVGEFLKERSLEITGDDYVYPSLETGIFDGSKIFAQKSRLVFALEGDEKKEIRTLQRTIGEAVREKNKLNVGEDDIFKPNGESFVSDGMEVVITHVKVEEEKERELIAFKTISNKDDELGWREKKVTQKGQKGTSEVTYKVVYHDGEEISRKKIKEEIVSEPVDEIITQGTYVKFGKSHTGLGSWYAQPQHLKNAYPSVTGFYAANPWLPKGSYVKVTNRSNGKSIIARINDRGPFGPNRIIDLSKEGFAAIASLGAGVVDVKMEEIVN